MDDIARQAPYIAALLIIVAAFLGYMRSEADKNREHDKQLELTRVENAKQREAERRVHESAISNMYANAFKSLVDQINDNNKAIVDALKQHELNDQERYDKMKITQDLLNTARESLARRKA